MFSNAMLLSKTFDVDFLESTKIFGVEIYVIFLSQSEKLRDFYLWDGKEYFWCWRIEEVFLWDFIPSMLSKFPKLFLGQENLCHSQI